MSSCSSSSWANIFFLSACVRESVMVLDKCCSPLSTVAFAKVRACMSSKVFVALSVRLGLSSPLLMS